MNIQKMNAEEKRLFEEMYCSYELYLRKIAYINDVPMDYIEDLVQDTFVSYAHHQYSLDIPDEKKKFLLIRILKSRCMDFHRRSKHQVYGELDEDNLAGDELALYERCFDLQDYVISKERCQALLEEIEKFPESWRQVAALKLIEGRPTREVCNALGITEKACYSRVSRIRKYLEELLKSDNWP